MAHRAPIITLGVIMWCAMWGALAGGYWTLALLCGGHLLAMDMARWNAMLKARKEN